jgi:hypothetical protein
VQAGLSETGDRAHQDGRDGPTDIQQAIFPVISHDRHLRGRSCDLVAPNAVRPERDEITIPGSMPNYGKRAKLILKWLGYDDGTINQMVADGSAGLRWSEKYLPE